MASYQAYLLVLLYITFQSLSLTQAAPTDHPGCTLAVSTSRLNLKEIRLQCGTIRFLEVQIPDKREESTFYRIITDGYVKVIQLFANAEKLLRCQVEGDSAAISKFLTRFDSFNKNESSTLPPSINATIDALKAKLGITYDISGDEIKEEFLNIQFLVDSCAEMMTESTLNAIQHRRQSATKNSTDWKGKLDLENGLGMKKSTSKRQKRFIYYPGTNWCGAGNQGPELGTEHEADACCKAHDECTPHIGALEFKYHYWNWRPSAILHSDCDDAFYTCLKDVDNEAANGVGDIFFNVLALPSFTTNYEEICYFWFWCEYDEVAQIHPARRY